MQTCGPWKLTLVISISILFGALIGNVPVPSRHVLMQASISNGTNALEGSQAGSSFQISATQEQCSASPNNISIDYPLWYSEEQRNSEKLVLFSKPWRGVPAVNLSGLHTTDQLHSQGGEDEYAYQHFFYGMTGGSYLEVSYNAVCYTTELVPYSMSQMGIQKLVTDHHDIPTCP